MTFQGMVQVAVPQKVFQVIEYERQDAQAAPLQDMGQLVGQKLFGNFDAPADENDAPPDLGLGPTGNEPGDDNEADGRPEHVKSVKVNGKSAKGKVKRRVGLDPNRSASRQRLFQKIGFFGIIDSIDIDALIVDEDDGLVQFFRVGFFSFDEIGN